MKTKEWKEGLSISPQPRFHAGIASATVPIAPVSAQLAAPSTDLSCGQRAQLTWKSADAADTFIAGFGEVPGQGDQTVAPTHNTAYVLTAKGPGGETTQAVTVKVDATPSATLTLSEPEVRYHKIGDRVVEDGSATLNWSTSNANSARVEPFNSDAMSGSRAVTAQPRTTTGPVNKTLPAPLPRPTLRRNNHKDSDLAPGGLHRSPTFGKHRTSCFFPTVYPTITPSRGRPVASEKPPRQHCDAIQKLRHV